VNDKFFVFLPVVKIVGEGLQEKTSAIAKKEPPNLRMTHNPFLGMAEVRYKSLCKLCRYLKIPIVCFGQILLRNLAIQDPARTHRSCSTI